MAASVKMDRTRPWGERSRTDHRFRTARVIDLNAIRAAFNPKVDTDMHQPRTALVAHAMALLDGFDIHSREDQIGLATAITVYRAKHNKYPMPESESMTALQWVVETMFRRYLSARMESVGACLGGVRLYDQTVFGAITGQDIQETHAQARALTLSRRGTDRKTSILSR